MSEPNSYQIDRNYKQETGEWQGYTDDGVRRTSDTWKDAIRQWLVDVVWIDDECLVVSEIPSEDGRSGSIEIQFDTLGLWVGVKVTATIIDED